MLNNFKGRFLTLFSLILISIQLKLRLLSNVIDNVANDNALNNSLMNLNKADIFSFVNFLYQKKIFSCLVCSLVLRKILRQEEDIVLHIGIEKTKDNQRFHAWLEKSNDVIFGNLTNLDLYKKIYSI